MQKAGEKEEKREGGMLEEKGMILTYLSTVMEIIIAWLETWEMSQNRNREQVLSGFPLTNKIYYDEKRANEKNGGGREETYGDPAELLKWLSPQHGNPLNINISKMRHVLLLLFHHIMDGLKHHQFCITYSHFIVHFFYIMHSNYIMCF